MDKKTIQKMAEDAGFTWLTTKDYGDELVRFAAIVTQAEREQPRMSFDDWRKTADVKGQDKDQAMREAFDAAAAIEREACAKVCDKIAGPDLHGQAGQAADSIRARSKEAT